MDDKLLLSANDVGRILGIGLSTVWRHHSAGRLPLPVHLGGATRWRKDELESWVDLGCPARDKWNVLGRDAHKK